MNKSKTSNHPIARYLRELSIIITGITISVGIGLWVSNMNGKRELKQHLLEVKLELDKNADGLEGLAKMLEKSVRYANYLRSTDNKSLEKDSLVYYRRTDNDGFGYDYFLSPSSLLSPHAFEMFKLSSTIRQVKNRELLSSLWEAYSKLEFARQLLDNYFKHKEEEVMKEWQLAADGKPVSVPMKIFHSGPFPSAMVRWCEEYSELLRRASAKLGKELKQRQ